MIDSVGNPRDQQNLQRLRRVLENQLNKEARARGVDSQLIRKQYVFALFFKRLFRADEPGWMLLGGNALLIRTGGGRFTRDIDLARDTPWEDPASVLDELQVLTNNGNDLDPFRFRLDRIDPHAEPDAFGYGTATTKIPVTVWLGNRMFDTFVIDITHRRHVHGPVDLLPLSPVIEHETLQSLPRVPVVAVENHLADKICAMYEPHGRNRDRPSTRYRDLADIVRIIQAADIDAGRLTGNLHHEQQRRQIVLPRQLLAPSPQWEKGFATAAKNFAEYPTEYHQLPASLRYAGDCLNPLLSGEITAGRWNARAQVWET